MDDFTFIWRLALLAGSSFALAFSIKQFIKIRRQKRMIEDSPIKQPLEALKANHKKEQLVRLYPVRQNLRYFKIDIGYNDFYFLEPSTKFIANHARMNEQIKNINWHSYISPSNKSYVSVAGLGEHITSDYFKIETSFKQKELGNFKTFLAYLAYYLECIVYRLLGRHRYNQAQHPFRQPLFKGPQIGILSYTVAFAANCSIIAACTIENGVITPSITGLSKFDLLEFLGHKHNFVLFGMVVFTIFTSIFSYSFWNYAKRMFKKISNFFKVGSKSKPLNPERISDDKACSICFVSCKNIVFFDCRHVTLCTDCWDKYMEETKICPICRVNIDKTVMIVEMEQK